MGAVGFVEDDCAAGVGVVGCFAFISLFNGTWLLMAEKCCTHSQRIARDNQRPNCYRYRHLATSYRAVSRHPCSTHCLDKWHSRRSTRYTDYLYTAQSPKLPVHWDNSKSAHLQQQRCMQGQSREMISAVTSWRLGKKNNRRIIS